MFTINVDHVAANIAADLCVRYPQVACERIEAMVASARERIEPTNTQDMPGYFLNDYDLAAEVLDAPRPRLLSTESADGAL